LPATVSNIFHSAQTSLHSHFCTISNKQLHSWLSPTNVFPLLPIEALLRLLRLLPVGAPSWRARSGKNQTPRSAPNLTTHLNSIYSDFQPAPSFPTAMPSPSRSRNGRPSLGCSVTISCPAPRDPSRRGPPAVLKTPPATLTTERVGARTARPPGRYENRRRDGEAEVLFSRATLSPKQPATSRPARCPRRKAGSRLTGDQSRRHRLNLHRSAPLPGALVSPLRNPAYLPAGPRSSFRSTIGDFRRRSLRSTGLCWADR